MPTPMRRGRFMPHVGSELDKPIICPGGADPTEKERARLLSHTVRLNAYKSNRQTLPRLYVPHRCDCGAAVSLNHETGVPRSHFVAGTRAWCGQGERPTRREREAFAPKREIKPYGGGLPTLGRGR